MRFVLSKDLQAGMSVAKVLYDNSGAVLLAKNVKLTDEYIRQIIARGYIGLYIEDEISKGIQIEESITQELRNRCVNELRSGNLDACLMSAKNIVQQILSSQEVSLDLVDLRTFDDYTYRHSVNVAVLATIVGAEFSLQESELCDLCVAALFHDLGKTQIPPNILNKPGRLTAEEYEIMKTHARLSYEMVKDRFDISAKSKVGILYHHENEDGTGYPAGLEGEELHLFAKIIHLVDVYDALTSLRPYKKPFPVCESIEYIMGGYGILFDKKVVDTFMSCVPVYPVGCDVTLSDGRRALVVENHKQMILRPRIRLYSGEELDLGSEEKNHEVTIKFFTNQDVETSIENENRMYLYNKKKTILIVDRVMSNLKILRSILEDKYQVVMFKSGKQVLEYLRHNEKPDLILMEIDIPEMSGIETMKHLKEGFYEDIAVILVSGLSQKETVALCRSTGADDYILKPLNAVYVKERVDMILRGFTNKQQISG